MPGNLALGEEPAAREAAETRSTCKVDHGGYGLQSGGPACQREERDLCRVATSAHRFGIKKPLQKQLSSGETAGADPEEFLAGGFGKEGIS